MATFTRNAWVTGETITAAGLNGGKGFPILEIEDADFIEVQQSDYSEYIPEFEIEIPTGLTASDFFYCIISASLPSNDYYPISVISNLGTYLKLYVYSSNLYLYYYPETGVLTTADPEQEY